MPLLNRKPYEVNTKLPAGLLPSEEVFVVSATHEVFRSYEDFLSKTVLYGRPVWSCALSGKGALTYEEAVKEEAKAKAALSKFPVELEEQVCRAVHHSTKRLDELVGGIHAALRPPAEQPAPAEQAPSPAAAKENEPQHSGGPAAEGAAAACSAPAPAPAAAAPAPAQPKRKAAPKAPATKLQLRAYVLEHAAQQGPPGATKLAWAVRPELAARFGLPAALPDALAAELAATVKAPKKRPSDATAAAAAPAAAPAAATQAAKKAKIGAGDGSPMAGDAAADAPEPQVPQPVAAKPLAEVQAQYAAGTVKHAIVAALVSCAPAGLTAAGIANAARALGVHAFEPKQAAQISHFLTADTNFVRLDKGLYSLHALHPHLTRMSRPPRKRKPAAEGEAAGEGGGEGGAADTKQPPAAKAAKAAKLAAEAGPSGSGGSGDAALAAADKQLKQAKASLSRQRGALAKAEAAVDAARAACAAARKGIKSPSKERRDSDVHVSPADLARFELTAEEREFKGESDDRKGLLEHRQRLQARARELDAARREFLEAARAAADAQLRDTTRELRQAEAGMRKAEAAVAGLRCGVEAAERAVAAAEKRAAAEAKRAGRGEQASEKERARAAEREERERRRAEAAAAKRYPIDDQELQRDLRAAAAAAGADPPPDVAGPEGWVEGEEGARLATALQVSDFFAQFGRVMGLKGLASAEFEAALLGSSPGADGGDGADGADGGDSAAGPAALHATYHRTLAFLLEDLRSQGAASAAEKRWASVLGGGTWPEVLRRFVLTRAAGARAHSRPDERAALAASMVAFDGADALTRDQHLALLRYLADEALDSERVRDALQKREDAAVDVKRDLREEMAEERRRLRELAEADKEERRAKREEERRRAEEEKAAAAAPGGEGAPPAAGAAAAAPEAAGEAAFELPPELTEYGGDPDDKKALLTWRQASQAERRRLDKARARWLGDALRAQREAEGLQRAAAAAERAREAEREAAAQALEEAEAALEEQLERHAVRRAPLGVDRHGRRYWWGLGAGRGEEVFVEGGPDRWGRIATVGGLAALLESLDRRGVRELGLAQALEKRWDAITAPMARAAAKAAAADKGRERERESERAAPLRASGRATKQVELYNPSAAAPRPASAGGASHEGAPPAAAAKSALAALCGPAEAAAVEAVADALLALSKDAAGAGVAPPGGESSWKAWAAAAAAARRGVILPDETGAATFVTPAGVRSVMQAACMQAEAALALAADDPEEGDDEEGGTGSEVEGEGQGEGGQEEEEGGGSPPRAAAAAGSDATILEAVDEDFSPSKMPREARRLWRGPRERAAWAADLRQAGTAARLAYAAAVLGQQAGPLLRGLRRDARGDAPAPRAARKAAPPRAQHDGGRGGAKRQLRPAAPPEAKQAAERDARRALREAAW